MNLPLRPWLPGPWVQPRPTQRVGGPGGEREDNGKEREIVWGQKAWRNYSFSALAFLTVGAHTPLCIIK